MNRTSDPAGLRASGSFHAAAAAPPAGAPAGVARSASAAGGIAAAANAALFTTPPELLCPVTHELLWDPVLTTSGQIYERAAIETHLTRAAAAGAPLNDPLTNAPLDSDQLLPVFPMRSRAAEYRENTVRACVAAAISEPRRSEAVRYLRRASELATPPGATRSSATAGPGGAGGAKRGSSRGGSARSSAGASGGDGDGATGDAELLVHAPGLSPELARFLVAHRGDAYNAVALKWFGNELMRGGFPDQAADVFYLLLLEECDRQQQADYLQLCLECWGHKGGKGAAQGDSHAAIAADETIIAKLADFVERQHVLSPGSVIDMLQAPTAIGRAGALRLCSVLLARASAAGDSGSGAAAAGQTGQQSGLSRSVELLVRYTQLSCAETADGVKQALQPAGGAASDGAAATSGMSAAGAGKQKKGASQAGGSSGGPHAKLRQAADRVRGVLSSDPARAAASCVLAAASLAGGSGLAVRVARLVPLLVLLHATKQQQQQH